LTRIVIDALYRGAFPTCSTGLKAGEQALVPAFWALEALNTLLTQRARHGGTDPSILRQHPDSEPNP
jgi:hypothetical protein